MRVVKSVADLKSAVTALRRQGNSIVFVPTMGNLHDGHLRLMDEGRSRGDAVIASIYVNPAQFGPGEDYKTYPRTEQEDLEQLRNHEVSLVFTPGDADVYPRGVEAQTRVEVPGLSDILCGASRPGHFRGVTTVVNRLFNLVVPDIAVFGRKDYQQLLLIQLMVQDLGLPVEIVGVDTVREEDGLAMSSRNAYLTQKQRAIAPQLYETLRELVGQIESGARIPKQEAAAVERLEKAGFKPEYISVRRRADLAAPGKGDRELVVLAAARLGRARLIDNIEFSLNESP